MPVTLTAVMGYVPPSLFPSSFFAGFLLPPFLSLSWKKKGIFLLKYSVARLLLKPCMLWGQADCSWPPAGHRSPRFSPMGRRVCCAWWAVWTPDPLAGRGPVEAGQMVLPGARTGSPTPSALRLPLCQGGPPGAWPGTLHEGETLKAGGSVCCSGLDVRGRIQGTLVARFEGQMALGNFSLIKRVASGAVSFWPLEDPLVSSSIPAALCLSFVLPSHPVICSSGCL